MDTHPDTVQAISTALGAVAGSLAGDRNTGAYTAQMGTKWNYYEKYPNMKELRIQHKGKPLRAFFAFDPLRQAIVLCAGDKSNDKQFYERMIKIADAEFTDYLQSLEQ